MMKAGVLRGVKDIRCERVDIPKIGDEEVLLKVTCSGICGSDYERVLITGTWNPPTILGHEFGGEIVEAGAAVEGLKVGDRAVVNPMVPCRKCDYCRDAHYNLCTSYDYLGSRSDGGFAEYAKVHYLNAYKTPDDMGWEEIAAIDPVAVGLHCLEKTKFTMGEDFAVIGTGSIGCYMIQWAKIFGAKRVIAVDISEEKLAAAKACGADYVINGAKTDAPDAIMDITNGYGVHVSIESAGSKITAEQCIRATAKMGRVGLLGKAHGNVSFSNEVYESIIRKELSIIGVWCYTFPPQRNEFLLAMDKIYKGDMDIQKVISHRFPVEDVGKAFELIGQKNEFYNKILIYAGEMK